jgi:hypothetical protein
VINSHHAEGGLVRRSRHPKKEVEQALSRAEQARLNVQQNTKRGHKWGDVGCQDKNHARKSVWSTPRNPGNHAKDINKYTDRHKNHRR